MIDNDEKYILLGQKIKEIRKQKKLTMKNLADQTELSQSAISMIENGLRQPTLQTLKKISTELGVDLTKYINLENKYASTEHIVIESLGFQLTLTESNFESDSGDHSLNNVIKQKMIHTIASLLNEKPNQDILNAEIRAALKKELEIKEQELRKQLGKL
ncbi:helix-turn-helix domain-containing protein [Priestia aryabhattai]|uniref:helix-turn-helix domain-containing protein n=1 Tax=Priestia aryabhattai TaxID=412384 RepID=UPI00211CAB5F|nr:helix-turn-helix domain-containing protein [Priestia aryabhattai]MCQ9281110.1 helix-turn-helix domain-containing protein [Priestia aryabhattai]